MSDPTTTILALAQSALTRRQNGDPDGFLELCAEDITYVDPGLAEPFAGLPALAAYLRMFAVQTEQQAAELVAPQVTVCGDAALLSYICQSSAAPGFAPGDAVRRPWNVTEVYFRRGGQWRLVHGHWSYVGHKLPQRITIPLPVRPSPVPYDGLLGELLALEAAAMLRWRQGDPWGFTELSAPDVTYVDTGTPQRIDGLAALKAEYAQREGKIFYDVMDFIDPQVQVCGELAVLFYRFLSTWLNPDGSVSHRTPWNCSEVFVQRQGRWQIRHTHWSFIRGEPL